MIRNIIFLTITAAIISLTGCKKVEDVNNGDVPMRNSSNSGDGMSTCPYRTFSNFDLFNAEVEKTIGFTYDELVIYEQSINFNSFGKLADQAMMPLLRIVEEAIACEDEELSTRSALEQMINANSQYLQIITDEDGEQSCETKYFRSTYRYVMNMDRIFKVDTFFFKVFEGGHASCGASHYNALLNLSESQFSLLEEGTGAIFNVFKYDGGDRGNYGTSKKQTAVSGKNRVHVEIYCERSNYQNRPPNKYFAQVDLRARINGQHKWCGIWWPRQSTHTCDLTAKVKIGNIIKTGHKSGSSGGFSMNVALGSWVGEWTGSLPYIYSAYGYGKIPPVTCNINWPE